MRSLIVVGGVVIVCVFLIGGTAAIARTAHVPIAYLLKDTVAVLHGVFYAGLVSNVGILLWGACVSICLFTGTLVRHAGRSGFGPAFFFGGAALSAWLMADDALLLHEQVFPDYLHLPGRLCLLIGFAATALFLIRFGRRIASGGHWILLLASLAALCASALFDQLHDLLVLARFGITSSSGLQLLIEDGLKLVGVMLWLGYFALTARDRPIHDRDRAGSAPIESPVRPDRHRAPPG